MNQWIGRQKFPFVNLRGGDKYPIKWIAMQVRQFRRPSRDFSVYWTFTQSVKPQNARIPIGIRHGEGKFLARRFLPDLEGTD